jgi:predicted neutral ceramidase superfamily lipid hydrolase
MNDYKIFSVYIIFGLLIMIGYCKMIMSPKNVTDKIWNNQGKNMLSKNKWLKIIYMMMIVISFIAGIYLIYYLTTTPKEQTDEILIYTGSVIFLVFSTVWAFRPFYLSKLILTLVFIGSILILAGICENSTNNTEKIIALVASSIILVQTGLFDLVIWNGIV